MKKRKDGRYEKQITVDGIRKTLYARSVQEMNKKIREYEIEKEEGKTFSDVADEWEERHYEGLSITTLKSYKPAVRRAIEYFNNRRIKSITAIEIDGFIRQFAKSGNKLKTVKNQKMVLNQIFDYAVYCAYTEHNPVKSVKLPKNLQKEKRAMPKTEEIKKIEENCTGFGLIAYFLLYTGLRRGEVLALRHEDIDRENKVIIVNKAVVFDGNYPIIKEPKTEAGKREVILLDRIAEKLPKGTGYIFHDGKGNLMKEKQFRSQWDKYKQKTGINLTPHQLRHAYATFLFEANIDEKSAQELLGHSTLAMTKDVYTHIRQEKKEATAKTLNSFNFSSN